MKSLVIFIQRTILWLIGVVVAFISGFVLAAVAINKDSLVVFAEVLSERLNKTDEAEEEVVS